MRSLVCLFTLSFLLVLPGCGAGERATSGIDADRLALEPELRIGSVDDPEQTFTWFRHLVVGPDGRIFTAHPQEQVVRIHDAEGRPVRTFGGRGEGPGEFRSVGPMGIKGDTLWVLDLGTYRFNYFDLDGNYLGATTVPVRLGRDPSDLAPRPRVLLPDGTVLGTTPAWSRLVATGELAETAILRMDTTGAVLDTVARRPLENTTLAVMNDEFRFFRDQPFSDTEMVEVSPHAPAVVRVDRTVAPGDGAPTFRVTTLTFDGDTVFSRTFPYTPVPIEPEQVDGIIQGVGESFEQIRAPGAPTPARAEELAREAIYVPEHHPPVSEVVIGRDGTIWLRREDADGPTVDWLILSPAGEPLGVVAAPSGLMVLAADRHTLWGMEGDELDVPYIVRYGVGGMAGATAPAPDAT